MASKKVPQDFDPNDFKVDETALAPLEGTDLALPMAEAHEVSLSDMARGLAAGDISLEQVLILEVGKGVEGELLGRGADMEVNSPNEPGKKNLVKTWRVRVYDKGRKPTNVTAILLSSSPLENQLPGKEGKLIGILRLPKQTVGSRIVNRYAVYEILNK